MPLLVIVIENRLRCRWTRMKRFRPWVDFPCRRSGWKRSWSCRTTPQRHRWSTELNQFWTSQKENSCQTARSMGKQWLFGGQWLTLLMACFQIDEWLHRWSSCHDGRYLKNVTSRSPTACSRVNHQHLWSFHFPQDTYFRMPSWIICLVIIGAAGDPHHIRAISPCSSHVCANSLPYELMSCVASGPISGSPPLRFHPVLLKGDAMPSFSSHSSRRRCMKIGDRSLEVGAGFEDGEPDLEEGEEDREIRA